MMLRKFCRNIKTSLRMLYCCIEVLIWTRLLLFLLRRNSPLHFLASHFKLPSKYLPFLSPFAYSSRSYDYYNLLFEVPNKSLRRTTRIDTNTRSVPRIADYNGYRSLVSNDRLPGAKGGEADEEEGTEVVTGGVTPGKNRTTPLYSIIKHFPTRWQRDLYRAAVAKGTFKDFEDTTIAAAEVIGTEEVKEHYSNPTRLPESKKKKKKKKKT